MTTKPVHASSHRTFWLLIGFMVVFLLTLVLVFVSTVIQNRRLDDFRASEYQVCVALKKQLDVVVAKDAALAAVEKISPYSKVVTVPRIKAYNAETQAMRRLQITCAH